MLFVLDGIGPADVENLIHALRAAAASSPMTGFLRQVVVLAATLTDLLRNGPSSPVWRPVHAP